MIFGPMPVARAKGAILAHSLRLPDGRLRKGAVLTAADLSRLTAAGLRTVTVARLEDGDIDEDTAAARLASALVPDPDTVHIRRGKAATGRVNLHATTPGVVEIDAAAVRALNRVHPMITFACPHPWTQTRDRGLVGTVKIISYGVPEDALCEAEGWAAAAIRVHPPKLRTVTLILTLVRGDDEPGKGRQAVADRLSALGMTLADVRTVPHSAADIAAALAVSATDLSLILTASATSDIRDEAPEAVRRAGGRIVRFGMPVDPG
ncbi:MAG: molybdopterin biosynthesis protein, partial [Pseudomonadota bacterium]